MSETRQAVEAGPVAHEPRSVHDLARSVPDVPGLKDIQVDPDDVLKVAGIIQAQADALSEKLADRLGGMRIPPPSDDVVSKHAVSAWNEVVCTGEDSYEKRVRDYVSGLRNLAEQLRKSADVYQLSDDEKAATFKDRHVYEA
ncbi:hypothetical protein [Amycolatopsis nigrescens]|uniref:hypothetical protein n=1 Tax=Amycolatopsis nigrescens TaxID=381445 RepID=UPI0003A61F58|nr:hypothetical protein [Amycolatopsis nigrescens]